MTNQIEEITEAEKRKRIIERLSDNVFVEAGAGAGKTTLIVSRIMNQLKRGMAPEKIVVITFTNAAAEELRSRITKKVREESVKEGLTEIEQKYLQRALQQMDLMKISTIHSFCFTLLKERIFDAKLPMNARLIEEAEGADQKSRLFTAWASELTETEWNRLIICGEKKSDILRKIKSLFLDICELPEDMDIYCDRGLLSRDFFAEAKPLVEQFVKHLCEQTGKILKSQVMQVADIPDSGLVAEGKKIKALLLWDEIPYMAVLEKIASKPTGKKKFLNDRKAPWPKGTNVEEADGFCREWYENKNRAQVDELLTAYKNFRYALLVSYALEARKYYRKERPLSNVTNDDLLQKTHNLICNSKEARAYFAEKISCLYVDEFQDTDHIQEEFIWRLCARADDLTQLRDGVLFLVGDPKQSIYRFRGAEPEVYFTAKEKMQKLDNAQVYCLDYNYRSNEKIISWVNESFRKQQISGTAPYRDMVFQKKLPAVLTDKTLAGVYYYQSPNKENIELEEDAVILAQMIATLVKSGQITDYNEEYEPFTRDITYEDFLILCYRKEDMEIYLKEMQNIGIPVQINGAVSLEENQAIGCFVRLFDYLTHRNDKAKKVGAKEALRELGWREEDQILAAISEEWKGMSPYGLAESLAARWELLLPKEQAISAELVLSVQSKLQQMLEQVLSADCQDLDSLSERFWRYRATVLERELPLQESAKAVRFMNLHKAKGLEGNIVVLAKRDENLKFHMGAFQKGSLYYPALSNTYKKMIWTSYADMKTVCDMAEQEEYEEQTRLQYVAATRAKQALIVMDAIKEGCMFSTYDFGEATGARSIVPILETMPKPERPTVEVKAYERREKKVEPKVDAVGRLQNQSIYRKCSPSDLEQVSVTKQSILAERKAESVLAVKRPKGNIFGTAMHRCLELFVERLRIDNSLNQDALKSMMQACVCQAIFESRDEIAENEKESYRSFLADILDSFAAWAQNVKLFSDENLAEVYTEYAFSFYDEQMEIRGETEATWLNGTADLILRDKQGHVYIIDYKSDRDDYLTEQEFEQALKERYEGQLSMYRRAAARLFEVAEENISLGLISFTEKEAPGCVRVRYTKM